MPTCLRRRPAFLGLAVILGILAGCGTTTPAAPSKQICIATDFPTSGADGTVGKPAENGVALALAQAKLHDGYTVSLKSFDDAVNGAHNPAQGAANLTTIQSIPCVYAVVGPLNNDVANAEIPIATNAGLAMISPANTNPGLTKAQYAAQYGVDFSQLHPSGKPEAYFRIAPTDDAQSKALAQLALAGGAKRAFVVDDAQPSGQGFATFFTQAFQAAGGTIAGHERLLGTSAAQMNALVTRVKAATPDFVFYGGMAPGGGLLRAALSADGLANIPMGGAGIAPDSAYVQAAGTTAAEGTVGTNPLLDVSALSSAAAQQFVADYKAKFGGDPTGYSASAFDAANLEIEAINEVIDAGQMPTRANVLDKVAHTTYAGITGAVSFDANGDNSSTQLFSVYKVENGAWVFVRLLSVR
ncbi:MAG: branched-chain amino acid ABC transporter substrate-binding protein [Ktedonobacterales bacterium]